MYPEPAQRRALARAFGRADHPARAPSGCRGRRCARRVR
ncbi:hypothetical protein AB0885_35840, partial [Streptomyces sp. NPDC005534]